MGGRRFCFFRVVRSRGSMLAVRERLVSLGVFGWSCAGVVLIVGNFLCLVVGSLG